MGDLIWNTIVDHIPVWGWVAIIGLPSLAALYYLGPILLPIWRMLPTPVKAVLAAALGGFLAYMGGRYRGRQNAEEEQRKRDAEAINTRMEVNRNVDKLSDKESSDRLRDRWTRD